MLLDASSAVPSIIIIINYSILGKKYGASKISIAWLNDHHHHRSAGIDSNEQDKPALSVTGIIIATPPHAVHGSGRMRVFV
jgi:hypothetical protein